MKKKAEREKYIILEEFKALLLAARDNDRDYMMLYLTGNLGLRVGELIRLRRQDFHYKEKYISIPTLKQETKVGSSKGTIKQGELPKKYIDIPLDEGMTEKIKEYIINHRIMGWLFLDNEKVRGAARAKRSHVPDWKAKRIFKKYARKAKLNPHYSIHSLRHFKGIETYKQFKDIRAVMVMLRHRSPRSSYVYTTMDLEGKRTLIKDMKVIE
ncbi:MAG: tyrosine-type recombinase/integrase [Candidatus Woesearchaeota archaeon]